jgi:hypothetical protein
LHPRDGTGTDVSHGDHRATKSTPELTAAIVSGALANKPLNGGEAWVRLTWALGLRRLGWDVTFIEQIGAAHCIDDHGRPCPMEASLNRRFFEQVVADFDLASDACLIEAETRNAVGIPIGEVRGRAADADLLINLTGHLRIPDLVSAPRSRVYVDLDPGFTQLWAAAGTGDLGLERHERHVTVGVNVGCPGCDIPTAGCDWIPVRPPVLIDHWPYAQSRPRALRFTTVARWRGPYGPPEHRGRRYGLKLHEFRKLIELPARLEADLELALAIDAADSRDLEALRAAGWRIVDPRDVARDPQAFREYVQSSDAEFSVAQGVYVETSSGWFSDRTGAYLASGKPALVQDTALGADLTAPGGVITFRTPAEAVTGAELIAAGYDERSAAARATAERCLDSDRVLGDLLERIAPRP